MHVKFGFIKEGINIAFFLRNFKLFLTFICLGKTVI